MTAAFKPGDLVVVTTINGGMSVVRKRAEHVWAGRIIAASVMGEGWWMVREVDPKTGAFKNVLTGRASAIVTVPEYEMSRG